MKILICDDDLDFSKKIAHDFKQYFKDMINDMDIMIVNKDFLDYSNEKVDICFMDIDLIETNGIEIVKKLKIYNKNMIVIFISVREDLVFNTFSVEPFQFLRKNHYEYDMCDTFERLRFKINRRYTKITIRDNKRYIRLDVDDIISVISIMHDLIINTTNDTFVSVGTLKKFYEENKNTNLVQIQKNLIINMDKIYALSKNTITYEDGKEYEIGRVYKKHF